MVGLTTESPENPSDPRVVEASDRVDGGLTLFPSPFPALGVKI